MLPELAQLSALAGIALIAAFFFLANLARRKPCVWRVLGGMPFNVSYCLAGGTVSEPRLRASLLLAYEALIQRGPWSSKALWAAFSDLRVRVISLETWHVESDHARTITVGPSLAALCHELAHLAERLIDREPSNNEHTGWTVRGIARAVAHYTHRLPVDSAAATDVVRPNGKNG